MKLVIMYEYEPEISQPVILTDTGGLCKQYRKINPGDRLLTREDAMRAEDADLRMRIRAELEKHDTGMVEKIAKILRRTT